MKKKLLSIVLTLCMALSLLPCVALAAESNPTKSIADSKRGDRKLRGGSGQLHHRGASQCGGYGDYCQQ